MNLELLIFYEEKATQTPVKKRILIDDVVKNLKPIVISGDAGTGKSTLLKKVGEKLIKLNQENIERKNIPVCISTLELLEEKYQINQLVTKKLSVFFANFNLAYIIHSGFIFRLSKQIWGTI